MRRDINSLNHGHKHCMITNHYKLLNDYKICY